MNLTRYILLCLLTLLVSCDAVDVVEQNDETLLPISFSNELANEANVTRAEGLETYRTTFYVYGYTAETGGAAENVFIGYRVNWIENTAGSTASNAYDWEYVGQTGGDLDLQTIKYWDLSASEYRFFGIAPVNSDSRPERSIDGNIQKFSFSADTADVDNVPYVSDLWYTNDVDSCASSPVKLVFRKPFCKVRIMLLTADGVQFENAKLLSDLSFAPKPTSDGSLITKGTITFSYPISGTETSYSFSTDAINTFEKITEPYETGGLFIATESEKWYTLLPPTPKQGAYSLKAVMCGKEVEAEVPATYMNWKPGYAYTYKFKVSEAIYLLDVDEVVVKKWEDTTPINHSIYNW